MSGKTSIEWATDVWNPTKGCDRVSPGCDHCYAMTMAKRLKGMGSAAYQIDGDPRTSGPGFLAHEWPDSLDWPLTVSRPMRVFVNSMSDLFHERIRDEFIARVFAVMALSPQHTFQLLTKRHARMRSLLSSDDFVRAVGQAWLRHPARVTYTDYPGFPLPNVWLGVSVENQQWADIRIPALLDTPAAVRFISAEPLLGPLNLDKWLWSGPHWVHDNPGHALVQDATKALGWVIVGGESGPGARPMHPDWVLALQEQCSDAAVPFLFKQHGAWTANSVGLPDCREPDAWVSLEGHVASEADCNVSPSWVGMYRVGKKAAGRHLYGRTFDGYPAVAT